MNFHGHEVWVNLGNVLTDESTEKYAEDIKEILEKYYKFDSDSESFDDSEKLLAEPYHQYEIVKVDATEYMEDSFKTITHLEVELPNDEAAKELAATIDGRVEKGLQSGKVFRITYRNEVYIRAETEDEARQAFENMDTDELNYKSKFVEMSSLEPQE